MSDRLYSMLPAIYRIRDAENDQPLRALLGIIEDEFTNIEHDMDQLYDNWFIETCEEWIVPYIADLLGVSPFHKIESNNVYSQRAFVAKTLSYRQRKGTLLMIEELAHDATAWGAHATVFFELLGWTQHLNHLRYDMAPNPNQRHPEILNPPAANRVGTINLRSLDVVDRIHGPFDICSHTVDIKPPCRRKGWHNIRKLGIFLWRLQSYPMRGVIPRRSETFRGGFHFSPIGNPIPLFNNPKRKEGENGLANETNVPGKIRPISFYQSPESYYGIDADKSIAVFRGTEAVPEALIPLEEIVCKDLSKWSSPPPGKVAIDFQNGRLAFEPGMAPEEGVTVNYHYGFSADVGGGPYDRQTTLEKTYTGDWIVTVARKKPENSSEEWRSTILTAIADWDQDQYKRAVITIADNGTYKENITLTLKNDSHLIVQASNQNRPTLRLRDAMDIDSDISVTGTTGQSASLTLNGLLIEGGISISGDSLGKLELLHCTLVPGRAFDELGRPLYPDKASLSIDSENSGLEVIFDSCITGALRVPENMKALSVRDSIIDHPGAWNHENSDNRMAISMNDAGDEPGPPTTLERVTVFGEINVKVLKLASEVIFSHRLRAQMRQDGCVRYSYVDDLVSITPRRFRCQPDLALAPLNKKLQDKSSHNKINSQMNIIRSRMRPDFTSIHYGDPGYAQLSLNTAKEIAAGGEFEAEMGAFEQLKQPQRKENLIIRLKEYMPYGLEEGIIFVT